MLSSYWIYQLFDFKSLQKFQITFHMRFSNEPIDGAIMYNINIQMKRVECYRLCFCVHRRISKKKNWFFSRCDKKSQFNGNEFLFVTKKKKPFQFSNLIHISVFWIDIFMRYHFKFSDKFVDTLAVSHTDKHTEILKIEIENSKFNLVFFHFCLVDCLDETFEFPLSLNYLTKKFICFRQNVNCNA